MAATTVYAGIFSSFLRMASIRARTSSTDSTGLPASISLYAIRRNSSALTRLSLVSRIRRLQSSALGYHLKTGHTLSVQNRPTGLAEDVIVLPCCRVRVQGLGLSPRSGVCYCGDALPGSRLAE